MSQTVSPVHTHQTCIVMASRLKIPCSVFLIFMMKMDSATAGKETFILSFTVLYFGESYIAVFL